MTNKAGPELDALVAEWMGWRLEDTGHPVKFWVDQDNLLTGWCDSDWRADMVDWGDAPELFSGNGAWRPSTDWTAAGIVVEKMITRTSWECYLTHQFDGWDCLFSAPDKLDAHGTGQSLPLAICLAALKAKGSQKREESNDS